MRYFCPIGSECQLRYKRIWAQSDNLSTFWPPIAGGSQNIIFKNNNGSNSICLIVTFFYGWMRFGALSVADCVLHSLSHAFFGAYGDFDLPTFWVQHLLPGLPSWVIDLSEAPSRDIDSHNFLPLSPLARALKFLLWVGQGKTEALLGHIGSLYCPFVEENIWQETMCTLFVSTESRCFFVVAAWWGVANNVKSTIDAKGAKVGKRPFGKNPSASWLEDTCGSWSAGGLVALQILVQATCYRGSVCQVG